MFLVQVSERKDGFEAAGVGVSEGELGKSSVSEVKMKPLLGTGFCSRGALAAKDAQKQTEAQA